MKKSKSITKWLFLNYKILIIFYCIITFISEPIACEDESHSDDKENDENNVILNEIITKLKGILSIAKNSKLIHKLDSTISVIMATLTKILESLQRKERSTLNPNGSIIENDDQVYSKQFNVLINRKLKSNEFLAVTGNIYELGNWDPSDAIKMNRSDITTTDDNDEIWTIDINIDEDEENIHNIIEYRYFIGSKSIKNNKISIIKWENHVEPRKYIKSLKNESSINLNYGIDDIDIFGSINGDISTDYGWLQEHETIVQFKFFRNPFNIKTSHIDQYRLKIIPYNSNDFNDDIFNNNATMLIKPSQEVNVKYCKLKYNQSELKEQPKNGVIYNPNDALTYHLHLSNSLEKINFLLNLYDIESEDNKILGYQYIKSNDLKNSEGDIEIVLQNFTNKDDDNDDDDDDNDEDEKKIVGSIKISYLIIKPLKISNFRLKTSFSNYWQSNWTALDVGHRGLGVSFKLSELEKPPAIENTVTSMKQAGIAGVDMVEFDVHLTKDLIPIIYHDFTILILNNTDKPATLDNLIRVHLQDLYYDELKSLKMYYKENDGNIVEYEAHNDEIKIEHRLFPTLEEFFDNIDSSIGFDIEIKWPQRYINGGVEANQTLDKNLFADRILKTLLEKGSGRLSFLSTFDADLCTMLKYKQNMYPVMFLTMGSIHHWTSYYDPRCESVQNAITNAKTWNLFGIVAHSKDYFNDPTLIDLSFEQNQKIFCWGSDINSIEAVEKMKDIGMTGVIYDRVDKFLINNETSIFKNDDLMMLFMKQHL